MQNTNLDEMHFHEETDTFDLTVTLNQNRLGLILKDYVDLMVYSKQYTEEDYCKEIHKKMDLIDIFNAFSQTKTCSDDEAMVVKQFDQAKLKKYELCTIVETDNLPCYKIQKQGLIMVYLNFKNPKTNKLITYESNLVLTKLRNLTEKQIQAIRSKTSQKALNKEIERYKKEHTMLQKKICLLEYENTKLRAELSDIKEESRNSKVDLFSKMQSIQENYNKSKKELLEDLKKVKKELEESKLQTNKQIKSQISQLKTNLEESFENKIKEITNQLNKNIENQEKQKEELLARTNQLEEEVRIQIQGQKQKTNQQFEQKITQMKQRLQQRVAQKGQQLLIQNQCSFDKFSQLQKQLQAIKLTLRYSTLPQLYSSYFKVQGLKVEYTGNNASWTQYIFNKPINPNQSAKFTFRITQTQLRNLMIGVVEYAKQKDKKKSYNSGNALCYFGVKGNKWPQNIKEGDGFRQGDVVEVQVDRVNSTIKYIVNGTLKATDTSQILADDSRVFMPYLEMANANDIVEWLME